VFVYSQIEVKGSGAIATANYTARKYGVKSAYQFHLQKKT